MESFNTLTERLSDFTASLKTLEQSLKLDLNNYKEIELDTIKNRQVQKFEYCVELCWKVIKVFLSSRHGIEIVSPKSAIKEFFRVDVISEQEYELLIQMIDDRNRLSHIYNDLFFEDIYLKLNSYLDLMKKVSEIMK